MTLAMLYAFICQLREERIARAAVKRARDAHPEVWQRLGWVYRRIMNPTFTIRLLSDRYGVSDPNFDAQLAEVRSLGRRKLVAVGAAFLCLAIVIIGTQLWGWDWDSSRDVPASPIPPR
jgi:hypothetical protein